MIRIGTVPYGRYCHFCASYQDFTGPHHFVLSPPSLTASFVAMTLGAARAVEIHQRVGRFKAPRDGPGTTDMGAEATVPQQTAMKNWTFSGGLIRSPRLAQEGPLRRQNRAASLKGRDFVTAQCRPESDDVMRGVSSHRFHPAPDPPASPRYRVANELVIDYLLVKHRFFGHL
jgi:hypothetical protein